VSPDLAEVSQAGQEALSGLQGHLAIEPPPEQDGDGLVPSRPPDPPGPAPTGHRLRLAVAAAASDGDGDGDGDQDATASVVRQAPAHGLDVAELVAVAEAHWPKPRLHRRAWPASRRWTAARLRRLHRHRRTAGALPRTGQP
jgi:hypothetical protein